MSLFGKSASLWNELSKRHKSEIKTFVALLDEVLAPVSNEEQKTRRSRIDNARDVLLRGLPKPPVWSRDAKLKSVVDNLLKNRSTTGNGGNFPAWTWFFCAIVGILDGNGKVPDSDEQFSWADLCLMTGVDKAVKGKNVASHIKKMRKVFHLTGNVSEFFDIETPFLVFPPGASEAADRKLFLPGDGGVAAFLGFRFNLNAMEDSGLTSATGVDGAAEETMKVEERSTETVNMSVTLARRVEEDDGSTMVQFRNYANHAHLKRTPMFRPSSGYVQHAGGQLYFVGRFDGMKAMKTMILGADRATGEFESHLHGEVLTKEQANLILTRVLLVRTICPFVWEVLRDSKHCDWVAKLPSFIRKSGRDKNPYEEKTGDPIRRLIGSRSLADARSQLSRQWKLLEDKGYLEPGVAEDTDIVESLTNFVNPENRVVII